MIYVHMHTIVKAGFGAVEHGYRERKSKIPLQLHGVTQGDAAGIAAL
jgi:hypothetical protein